MRFLGVRTVYGLLRAADSRERRTGRASRLASVEKAAGRAAPLVAASHPVDSLRFRADGLRSHRAKLGISAADYGKLVGVSGLTIYHWEHGKAKPRRKQLASLAAVRGLGKREALHRLERA